MTNEDLTRLYNEANGIPEGKAPPITTERIFCAMRAAMEQQRLAQLRLEREALGNILKLDDDKLRERLVAACVAYDARTST